MHADRRSFLAAAVSGSVAATLASPVSAQTALPKLPAKQAGVSAWAWGTGETIVIVAMMLAGYRVSGRLAKRRALAAAMTAADNPDDLIGA